MVVWFIRNYAITTPMDPPKQKDLHLNKKYNLIKYNLYKIKNI